MGDTYGIASSCGSRESRHACEIGLGSVPIFGLARRRKRAYVHRRDPASGTENLMIDKKHNKEDLPVKTGQAKTTDPELMQNSTGTAGPTSPMNEGKFLG